MKIRTKLGLFIVLVVVLNTAPLSIIVLVRNQKVLLEKTFEVCRNLGNNIANLATEELLIDQTYEATSNAMRNLEKSDIRGLADSYVINLDGRVVASLARSRAGNAVNKDELKFLFSLSKLESREEKISAYGKPVLRFVYPIFILSRKGENLRVGSAVFVFDRQTIYAPVEELRKSILVLSTGLLLFVLVIGLVAAVRFARPIQALTDGARIIGEGDLSHRIKISSRDEIGRLANSFNTMTDQIRDFTQNLEHMVTLRTEELNKALLEVTALKQQQDGDYFLTSLLMEPLNQNKNTLDNIEVNFLVDQKKKFQFKKWSSEIGGDICAADTLVIGDTAYTLFVNADAMGKSMQGAGGVLVLGALLQAIIVRSKAKRGTLLYPELWLRDTFLDLQSIFVSFNGSMYSSVVIGLLSEEGMLYFINAEHPWIVLYRAEKATFLEEELMLRKLGVPEQEERLSLRMFLLEPGDRIICGSDGRDDILVNSESGENMNEDERLFLKHVENGKGDIEKIRDNVVSFGKITDDLSLISLHFKKPSRARVLLPDKSLEFTLSESKREFEEGREKKAMELVSSVLERSRTYPDLLKWAGRLFFHSDDFERAISCYSEYLSLVPNDDDVLYIVSAAYRLSGLQREAADHGERLYLRNRNHFLNLLNLAVTYSELGIYHRGLNMAARALEIDPDHAEALDVHRRLSAALSHDEFKEKPDPDYVQKRLDQGLQLYHKRDYYSSLRIFEELVEVDPENVEALFRAANCLKLIGHLQDSVRLYNRLLVLDPNHYRARNNLAVAYCGLQRPVQAKSQLEKALAIKKEHRPARINIKRLRELYDMNHEN